MPTALVTGSAGLIGSEAVTFLSARGFRVLGIDNDMRQRFFGADASTARTRHHLEATLPNYVHHAVDVRDAEAVGRIFADAGSDLALVVHTAGQPSHEWAAGDPRTDFAVNANGTLNLLETTRQYCPKACFIFTSTNKVYGANPNKLPMIERGTRWEIDPGHAYYEHGIDEAMSLDDTTHSLFGVSKLAADALVQEYGRYFGMNTVCFRCGCVTGPGQAGGKMHGFLSYLMKCAVADTPYTVFGYGGKQVRDNIHAFDLVNMFWHYYQAPRPAAVYNAGGGRHANCSVREAIAQCEQFTGRKMKTSYSDKARIGDHIWYISDTRRFETDYPGWSYAHDLKSILKDLHERR